MLTAKFYFLLIDLQVFKTFKDFQIFAITGKTVYFSRNSITALHAMKKTPKFAS